MTFAVEVREQERTTLFGSSASIERFDRDTTCGCGIEVEYAGSSGKLIYYRGAESDFLSGVDAGIHTVHIDPRMVRWTGTGIRPAFVVKTRSLARELRAFTLRILRLAGSLLSR